MIESNDCASFFFSAFNLPTARLSFGSDRQRRCCIFRCALNRVIGNLFRRCAFGRVRAKQDPSGDTRRERGMALLIHGDAAFAAKGISQETLNLSQLLAYRIGGTLHVIVNNQIGFTPPRPQRGR